MDDPPLVSGLKTVANLDPHIHHHHAAGADTAKRKARIRELKRKRDEILASADKSGLKVVLREIHNLKHALRRA